MFYAVHVVTEGGDHYNLLIGADDADELVGEIKNQMYGDFHKIYNLWVNNIYGQDLDMEKYVMGVVEDENDLLEGE